MSAQLAFARKFGVAALALGTLFAAGRAGFAGAAQLGGANSGQFGQTQQPGFPTPPDQSGLPSQPGLTRPNGITTEPGVPPHMVVAAARARAEERQKRLVADSDKLLALVTQLHADVARTDRNMLSVEVIHRAEEIEKLARSVKERERGQ